jgi:hypothetical protein
MSTLAQKTFGSDGAELRKVTERACNDPQRMRARKIEAEIMEKMPLREWLSSTAVSRLIRAPEDRKTPRPARSPAARRQGRAQTPAGHPRTRLSVPQASVSDPLSVDG